jgi:hypothetical protein
MCALDEILDEGIVPQIALIIDQMNSIEKDGEIGGEVDKEQAYKFCTSLQDQDECRLRIFGYSANNDYKQGIDINQDILCGGGLSEKVISFDNHAGFSASFFNPSTWTGV